MYQPTSASFWIEQSVGYGLFTFHSLFLSYYILFLIYCELLNVYF